jgi:hypothetical protein
VFRVHAALLEQERRIYGGPVLSEGACHWFFAGLVDSNYAQTSGMDQPGLVDFQLLKLHPLNTDCGAEITQEDPDRLAAYCLAHGLAGHYHLSDDPPRLLNDGERLARFLKAYFTIHTVQPFYAGVRVREIRYADTAGRLLGTEDAVRADAHTLGRTRVVYENGLTVHVNLGDTPWVVPTETGQRVLPRNGWHARLGDTLLACHTLVDGHPVHLAVSPERIYLDGNGTVTDFGLAAARYACLLRREAKGVRLNAVPFRGDDRVTIRAGTLGLKETSTVAVTADSGMIMIPGRP